MQWNRGVTLVLVVLMLTAGCLGNGDTATSDSASAGDGEGASTPSDMSTGTTDGPALTDPEAALRDAGSFTVTWQYAGVDVSGVRSEVRHEYYADLRGERSLTSTSSHHDGQPDGTTEQFVTEGTTYLRTGPADTPAYATYPGTTDVVGTAIALSQARADGANEDMARRGTETFDGVTVTRYELTEASSQLVRAGSTATNGAPGIAEITDFHYAVLVDEEGLSRYESWSFTGRTTDGETVSGEWEYSLTGVGSTTIDDPDWLAAAQATADA